MLKFSSFLHLFLHHIWCKNVENFNNFAPIFASIFLKFCIILVQFFFAMHTHLLVWFHSPCRMAWCMTIWSANMNQKIAPFWCNFKKKWMQILVQKCWKFQHFCTKCGAKTGAKNLKISTFLHHHLWNNIANNLNMSTCLAQLFRQMLVQCTWNLIFWSSSWGFARWTMSWVSWMLVSHQRDLLVKMWPRSLQRMWPRRLQRMWPRSLQRMWPRSLLAMWWRSLHLRNRQRILSLGLGEWHMWAHWYINQMLWEKQGETLNWQC